MGGWKSRAGARAQEEKGAPDQIKWRHVLRRAKKIRVESQPSSQPTNKTHQDHVWTALQKKRQKGKHRPKTILIRQETEGTFSEVIGQILSRVSPADTGAKFTELR